jgi:triphosphoribosyl-dephospho-CoA synthase
MKPRDAFLRACELDVLVRKPGNVSIESPGHGMVAQQFIEAARAAAPALFTPGAAVGERIERAVAASLAAAGCNANLGIVLLAAPIAAAAQADAALAGPAALRRELQAVLQALDVNDTQAAFRAIAAANPGGLGSAAEHDVHEAPTLPLRAAMALAAHRDSIARQYADGFAGVFDLGLPLAAPPVTPAVVQRVFLGFLASWPDSHIVRKHGVAAAHSVMSAAQGFSAQASPGQTPQFAVWDGSLKAQGINPGTSADLTVASVMLALLWHGS